MRLLFEDAESGGFFSSPADDPTLVMRVKEDYDGAEPSGNSIAASNLLRLAAITGRDDLRRSADRTVSAFGSRITHVPVAIPQMMASCEWLLGGPREIVLAGEGPELWSLVETVQARFVPHKIVLQPNAAELAPWIAAMQPV